MMCDIPSDPTADTWSNSSVCSVQKLFKAARDVIQVRLLGRQEKCPCVFAVHWSQGGDQHI